MKSDRFQNQIWYVKLWRYRYYYKFPFNLIRLFFFVPDLRNKHGWNTTKSLVYQDMKWYYTLEELDNEYSVRSN